MVALPTQLFYTTGISVCLWFISKDKKAESADSKERGLRNRSGETLFIDARNLGHMISRVHRELSDEDIKKITDTYHSWRGEKHAGGYKAYEDEAGFCKSATLDEIKANDYVLTPGRYVGAAAIEDDGIPFETKMSELSQTLYQQMVESEKLDQAIRRNLEVLGYGE